GGLTIETGNSVGVDGGSTLSLAGTISAAGPLTKVGLGTLVLNNASTNVGAIDINAGAVNLAGAVAAPAGTPINVSSGGSVGVQGGYNMTLPVNLSGSGIVKGGALRSLNGSNTINGAVTLNGDAGVGVDSGSTLTIN